MKIIVTESIFRDAFKATRPDQFSRDALNALFDHYSEMEQDDGEEMELDVVAICCDWSEYASAEEAATDYGWTRDAGIDDEEAEGLALDYLRNETQVIQLDGGGVIIQQF